MNKKEMLLTILMEECAEVQQAISKALRFCKSGLSKGPEEAAIVKELFDVFTVFDIAVIEGILDDEGIEAYFQHAEEKTEKINEYMKVSKSAGRLIEGN